MALETALLLILYRAKSSKKLINLIICQSLLLWKYYYPPCSGQQRVNIFNPFLMRAYLISFSQSQISTHRKADNSLRFPAAALQTLCARKCNQQQHYTKREKHHSVWRGSIHARLAERCEREREQTLGRSRTHTKCCRGYSRAAPFGKQTQSARGARSHKFDWGQFLWNNKHSSAVCVCARRKSAAAVRVCVLSAPSLALTAWVGEAPAAFVWTQMRVVTLLLGCLMSL